MRQITIQGTCLTGPQHVPEPNTQLFNLVQTGTTENAVLYTAGTSMHALPVVVTTKPLNVIVETTRSPHFLAVDSMDVSFPVSSCFFLFALLLFCVHISSFSSPIAII